MRFEALKLVLVHDGKEDVSSGYRSFTPNKMNSKCDKVTARDIGSLLLPTLCDSNTILQRKIAERNSGERCLMTAGENSGTPLCLAFPLGIRNAKVEGMSHAPKGCKACLVGQTNKSLFIRNCVLSSWREKSWELKPRRGSLQKAPWSTCHLGWVDVNQKAPASEARQRVSPPR